MKGTTISALMLEKERLAPITEQLTDEMNYLLGRRKVIYVFNYRLTFKI